MKKNLLIATFFILTASLVGCGDDDKTGSQIQQTPPETIIVKYDSSTGEMAMSESAAYISPTDFKSLGSKLQELDYHAVKNQQDIQDDQWDDSVKAQDGSWLFFRRNAKATAQGQKRSTKIHQTNSAPWWFAAWLIGSAFTYPFYYYGASNYYSYSYSYMPTYYYGNTWYPYYGYGSSYYYNYGGYSYYPYYCHY